MAGMYELAYVYARVCGSLANSLAGGRAAELLTIGRLSEAWRAFFHEAPPPLPEAALVAAAESKALAEAMYGFNRLAGKLKDDEPFFVALRRKLDFSHVKRVLLAVKEGEAACPAAPAGSVGGGFNESAYPELEAMFAGSRYSWIRKEAIEDLAGAENRLDRQFYGELWASIATVPLSRRAGLRELVSLEIELENVVWALRLVHYYRMGLDRIGPLLVTLPDLDVVSAALAGARLAGAKADSTEDKVDKRSAWEGWKYSRLLPEENESWVLDVRQVEAAARHFLYRKLRRALHRYPSTYTPLYCYFKLKEFETAVLLGLVEGIYLGAPAEEIVWLAPAGGLS